MPDQSLTTLIYTATNLVILFLPWGGALLWFTWTMGDVIWGSRNPEKRKQTGARIFWAIVAMFVLFSVGAIVAVINNTFFRIIF